MGERSLRCVLSFIMAEADYRNGKKSFKPGRSMCEVGFGGK